MLTVGAVHASARVSGGPGAVRLDATGSTVAEALSALQSAFRLRVTAPVVLDRVVNGTYTGTLPEILSHLLRGYNYFINTHGTKIEVTVIKPPGNLVAAAQPPRGVPGNTAALSLANAARLKIH